MQASFLSSNSWWVLGCVMEGAAKQEKEGSVPDSSSSEGGRTWAKVMRGQSRLLVWTSYKISEAEVDQLR